MANPSNQPDFSIDMGGRSESSIIIRANPQWASTITNRLEPYKSLPNKFRPALEAVADYMTKQAIPRVFEKEGPGWRPLSLRTRRERVRAGFSAQHPILVRTGDLFRELTDRSHPKHIEIVKVGPQARIIIGGTSEKYVRNQLGNTELNIPSRPMIPGTGWLALSSTDDQQIRDIITKKIKEAMQH